MSIKNNTTSLQDLLERVNNLPNAGGVELPELSNPATATEVFANKELIDADGNKIVGTFTIENELSAQDELISQIQAVVDNLPEAGGGSSSGNIETATVELHSSDDSEIGAVFITYENNNYKPVTWHLAPATGGSDIFSNVIIDSYVFITLGYGNEYMSLELTGSLEIAAEITFMAESTKIIVIKVNGNGSIRFFCNDGGI